MHPTRREMIRLGLGSSALLACGPTVPLFLARSANALADDRPSGPNAKGRILVVVQLDGGNDGLNTVVPYRDDEYRKQRPGIQISAGDVRKIDDRVGLHPTLEEFSKLLEQQRLAIVQSVGYPNPNRSHFESMAIWQTARTEPGQGGARLAGPGGRPSPRPAGRRARPAYPRGVPAAEVARGRASGDPVAGPPRAVPPTARRARRVRPRRAGRGPRSTGPPGTWPARLAPPVRRAVLA